MTLRLADLPVGDGYEELLVDGLTRTQIVQYAGASGDFNPVHTDEVYATQVVGYPSVFGHGMLTMGLTARMVTNYVGDGKLLTYGVRFQRQVWPGDTLVARATVTGLSEDDAGGVVELAVATVNQAGDAVLSGTATARVER
jgi:acyl dehydratase